MTRAARSRIGRPAIVFTLALVVATAAATASPASAQSVPDKYRRHFVHYVDSRSFLEKALNAVGLTNQDMGRSFALIAGVENYPNMSRTDQRLPAAGADIRRIAAHLRNHEYFDEIVVLRDAEVNEENIAFFLNAYFPERLRRFPKSRFLFAYSGHGTSTGSLGFLLKSTARSTSDTANSIPLTVVRAYMDGIIDSAHHTLVLLNACYSGAFLRRSFGARLFPPANPGAHAITAGGTAELAWHDPTIGSGSIFFEKFLAGLDGRADVLPKRADGSAGDGVITVDELGAYLRQEVQISTDQNQNPQVGDLSRNGSLGGFFFLNTRRTVVLQPTRPVTAGRTFGESAESILAAAVDHYQAKRYVESLPLFREAAKKGEAGAAFYIGYSYDLGLGTTVNYVAARQWYEKAVALGDSAAMNNLGVLYEEGQGVPRDWKAAMQWYSRGAAAGDATAMSNVGDLYESGKGVTANREEALKWYRKAAALEDEDGIAALKRLGASAALKWASTDPAEALKVGLEHYEAKRYAEAFEPLIRAGNAGKIEAASPLGYLYDMGLGTTVDYVAAREWYEKAAAVGTANAMNNLGALYENGLGVPRDLAAAMQWYSRGAAAGDEMAMWNVGDLYEFGKVVTANREEALKWYRKAAGLHSEEAIAALTRLGASAALKWASTDPAEALKVGLEHCKAQRYAEAFEPLIRAGNAGKMEAAFYLGYLYDMGLGTTVDYVAAREWYEKAAAVGSGLAMNNLGALYENGEGGPSDLAAAMQWYSRGAAAGEAMAMWNVGDLYEFGKGVTANREEALKWYRKAAALHSEEAIAALKRLGESR